MCDHTFSETCKSPDQTLGYTQNGLSAHNFLSNVANRQADRRQINNYHQKHNLLAMEIIMYILKMVLKPMAIIVIYAG